MGDLLASKKSKMERILSDYLERNNGLIPKDEYATDYESIEIKTKLCFIQKVLHCSKTGSDSVNEESADILAAVYLRNFFELLIFIRLSYQDIKYKYCLYVLSASRRLEENRSLVNALKLQRKVLLDTESKETIERDEISNINSAEEKQNRRFEFTRRPYDADFNIFNTEAEYWGLGATAYNLEKSIIPTIESDAENIKSSIAKFYKNLVNEEHFQSLFPGIDELDVEEKLDACINARNLDTWFKKAHFVGLEDPYRFVYALTSSLIHATNFSLYTKIEMNFTEKQLIERMNVECLVQATKILLPDEYKASVKSELNALREKLK